MPEWNVTESGAVGGLTTSQELFAERQMGEMLRESLADLELAMEDRGWARIGMEASEFTGRARRQASALASVMAIANPLIKRGLSLRCAYVWGQGVQVLVRDDGDAGQDVNEVFQEFLQVNGPTFWDSEAQVQAERQLGTHGEIFYALPTNTVTGEVRVRSIDPDEVVDIITDPEDYATVWFFKRTFTVKSMDRQTSKTVTLLYPDIDYRPATRPATMFGFEVRWASPVRWVAVNRPGVGRRGIGDAYAALPWARADKEFLENWATLMKSLARISWQVTTKASKAQAAAAKVAQAPLPGQQVGGTVAMDPNSRLEAVSKSGATIDAESHKPLASMVAAALEVPLTMLLGDPGSTGARAVAETLDQPTELTMGLRQNVHAAVLRDIGGYVIDMAVKAHRLRGTVRKTLDGREIVTLPDGDGRTIEVSWPEFSSTPVETLVKAIAAADQTERVPPLVIARLLLAALGVEDADEVLEEMTDDQGNWIPLDVKDQQTRTRLGQQGQDV